MVKDWPAFAGDMSGAMAQLRAGLPDVMKAFGAIDHAMMKDGALSPKSKELIALALGVAARCDGCLAFHARAVRKYGATREEVLEALGMSIYMGGGPSVMYAALALEAYDQYDAKANG